MFRIVVLCFFLVGSLYGAPRRYYDEDTANALREMRDTIEMLRHEVGNHETEMKMLEERINNQENTISALRQQMLDSNQGNKELVKSHVTPMEGKLAHLELANKGLVADLLQLKNHANDTSSSLHDLKNSLTKQTKNIDHLQSALRSLTELLQNDGSTSKDIKITENGNVYHVKPGDSLSKIAQSKGTTTKLLKEKNHLNNDQIYIGQKLYLP